MRPMAQNKDTQKVDSRNRCHGPSQCTYKRHYPLDVCHFEYFKRGKCLSNVHCPWNQHFDDELQLRENHMKIIGKTKKSTLCVSYSVPMVNLVTYCKV